MTEHVDCAVIGAGVVGLAIARLLARRFDTVVLEEKAAIGSGISSRSSEVIHAGLYYAPGSLKATLCARGRTRLAAYCRERGVAHSICGKLLVATTPAQSEALELLRNRAASNGVRDLAALSASQAKAMEPALKCERALHSPSTGIVDSHELMLALQADLEAAGGVVALNSRVVGGECRRDGTVLRVGDAPTELQARLVINCAGLGAQRVAGSLVNFPSATVPPLYFAKGSYFSLSGHSPFRHLVYPVPEPGGLGIHLTLDGAGRARFGPDVQWVDEPDYSVDVDRASLFYEAIRSYWPALPDAALRPAYAGVRPKLTREGEAAADFAIHGHAVHGVKGLVNLYGIESPGLTSALAIAEHVETLL